MHSFEQDYCDFQLLLLESLFSDLRVYQLGSRATSSDGQTNRGAFWLADNLSITFSLTLQIKFKINYRYGTIYREIFNFNFEWCEFMDGLSKGPFQAAFLSILKKSAPQLFQNCPMPPVSQFFKIFPFESLEFLPAGHFRTQERLVWGHKLAFADSIRTLQNGSDIWWSLAIASWRRRIFRNQNVFRVNCNL